VSVEHCKKVDKPSRDVVARNSKRGMHGGDITRSPLLSLSQVACSMLSTPGGFFVHALIAAPLLHCLGIAASSYSGGGHVMCEFTHK
jgi:hypothetical protein